MKISPVSASGMTVGSISADGQPASIAQKIRSMKMNTNATPGRVEMVEPVEEPKPEEEKLLSIPDEGATAATEATQPLSPQLAAIARQRRALHVKEREIADREKALTERSASADVVEIAKLKSDPLGVLLGSGVTYEQLAQAVQENMSGVPPEVRQLKDELKSLKADIDKNLADRDAQTEKAALAQMQREATQIVSTGNDFELVRETGSIPRVMTLIERVYRETGNVLDVTEALTLIEDELVKDGLKIAALNKVRSQLSPAETQPQPPQQQRQMRTLTNRDTASVPADRKARAMAAFYGTLKK